MKTKAAQQKAKIYIFICFISILLIYGIVSFTLASTLLENPDYEITISTVEGSDKPGITHGGNLFGEELWYPGKQKDGIIKIRNNCPMPVRITYLGVDVNILEHQPGLDSDFVLNSFLNNMEMTVNSRRLLLFSNRLINSEFLSNLIDDNANSSNLSDGSAEQPVIANNDFIEINGNSSIVLKYSLKMREESGEELEAIKASVDFTIKFE